MEANEGRWWGTAFFNDQVTSLPAGGRQDG